MNLTDGAENEVLEALFRGTGIYSNKAFRLFSAGTSLEAGALTDELTSTGYAPVTKTGNAPFGAASGGVLTTSEIIQFPENTGGTDWTAASHWGITVGGVLKVWGALTPSVTVQPGYSLRINVGGLTITLS